MVHDALFQSISSYTRPHFTPTSAAAFSIAVPAVFGMWTNASRVLWCLTFAQRVSMRMLGAARAEVDATSILYGVRPWRAGRRPLAPHAHAGLGIFALNRAR